MNQTDITGNYNYMLRGWNSESSQGQYWLSYFYFCATKTHPSTLLGVSKTAMKYALKKKKDENEAKVLQKFAHIYLAFQLLQPYLMQLLCLWSVVLKMIFLMWAEVFILGCRRNRSRSLRHLTLTTLLFTKLHWEKLCKASWVVRGYSHLSSLNNRYPWG